MGEGRPEYLPVDDDHPARPRSPYGLSKLLAEDVCRYFTETAGMTTIGTRSNQFHVSYAAKGPHECTVPGFGLHRLDEGHALLVAATIAGDEVSIDVRPLASDAVALVVGIECR